MKIPTPCAICFLEGRQREAEEGKNVPIIMLPGVMTDNGYINVTCPKGHQTTVIYDERKFELLFQSACHTFNDGYEREAVSGFSASLERLYEFYIRVVCRAAKIDQSVLEKTWKHVSRQSERQFGCFIILYALHTGKAFDFDKKQVEFRNKVVHQGYIPKTEEVMEYGAEVWRIKRMLWTHLKDVYPDILNEEIEAETAMIKKKASTKTPPLIFKATVVNVNSNTNTAYEIKDFEGFLEGIKTRWNCDI